MPALERAHAMSTAASVENVDEKKNNKLVVGAKEVALVTLGAAMSWFTQQRRRAR